MHRARLIPTLSLLASLAVAFPATVAHAQTGASQNDRVRARELALQGINAFNRSDFAASIERFETAERSFHAPVHLRYLALAYERSTPPRLLDAYETWRRLSQERLAPDAPAPFRDAVAEAARELPRVEALLGSIAFTVTNGGPGMVLEIDGRPVPNEELGRPRVVAPGEHTVTARRAGFVDVRLALRVETGRSAPAAVVFEPVAASAPPPPEQPVATVPAPPDPRVQTAPQTQVLVHANPVRTLGGVLAGLGGAALIGGIITGVMASGAFSELQEACPNNVCRTQDDLDLREEVDALSGATNGLLIGGGVLLATGVVMVIVGRPRTETVQVSAGPRGGSLTIRF